MDFQTVKKISIPEGNVKSITEKSSGAVLWKAGYQNLVPTSIDTDGSIFNGCGYKNGYRVRSSGAVAGVENAAATGYIPVKAGDTLRLRGGDWGKPVTNNCVHYSGEGFASLGSFTPQPAYYGICTSQNAVMTEVDGVYTHVVPNDADIRYVRISMYGVGIDGKNLVVTVNEEIKE